MESYWSLMKTCKRQCRCREFKQCYQCQQCQKDTAFQMKEAALIRLREELVRVRGPLPEDGEDSASLSSQDTARSVF